MRVMEIPPFPRKIEILHPENFLRTRLGETVVMWPDQAIPQLGYMCFPNDEAARDDLVRTLHCWPHHSGGGQPTVPDGLGQIQTL